MAGGAGDSVRVLDFRVFRVRRVLGAPAEIGDERTPDVTADLVEVHYGFTGFWTKQSPWACGSSRVTLHRPIVRAGWHQGQVQPGLPRSSDRGVPGQAPCRSPARAQPRIVVREER